ncbi:MAG: hypothetical protein HYU36_04115 [Planctomycetes bacterium]|nr:hypothetical protein [Planctomycetota bacterium]
MTWQVLVACMLLAAFAGLVLWNLRLGRRRSADFQQFLKAGGFQPAADAARMLQKALLERYPRWQGIEQPLHIQERTAEVSEPYQTTLSGKPVYFFAARLQVRQGPLPRESSEDYHRRFFLLPWSPGPAGPFVVLIEADLPIPKLLKAFGHAADAAARKALGDTLAVGGAGETILLQPQKDPGPFPGLEWFSLGAESVSSRMQSDLLDLLQQAPQQGLLRISYRDGVALLETLYGTLYNFQGFKQVVGSDEVWRYVRRFAGSST